MLRRTISFILLSLIISPSLSFCQQFVRGKIYNAKGDEVIPYATVINISSQKNNVSDLGGNYKIEAKEGDTLIFSSASYFPDTLKAEYFMLHNVYDISLKPHSTTLSAVTVNGQNNYYQDSLNRHEYYKDEYAYKKNIIDKHPPLSDGVGIKFSLLGHFSSKEKEKREFRKTLEQEDKDNYIDSKFSYSYVSKLTRLKDDSLRTFMSQYRPSYKFCRKASSEEMFFYVNDCMKKFMKRKEQIDP